MSAKPRAKSPAKQGLAHGGGVRRKAADRAVASEARKPAAAEEVERLRAELQAQQDALEKTKAKLHMHEARAAMTAPWPRPGSEPPKRGRRH